MVHHTWKVKRSKSQWVNLHALGGANLISRVKRPDWLAARLLKCVDVCGNERLQNPLHGFFSLWKTVSKKLSGKVKALACGSRSTASQTVDLLIPWKTQRGLPVNRIL